MIVAELWGWDLGEWAEVFTGLAAVAAIGAAVVTAWMAWATRKMAIATRDAVRVGQAQLRVAADALDVARSALDVGRDEAQEVIRAHLDAQAPRVWLNVSDPDWPPYKDRAFEERWPEDATFELPRDGDACIVVLAWGSIINEGLVSAVVDSSEFVWSVTRDLQVRPDGAAVLRPGGEIHYTWTVAITLREAVDYYTQRRADTFAERATEVIVRDGFDAGVVDHAQVRISLDVVRPRDPDGRRWGLGPPEGIGRPAGTSVMPSRRDHWASRLENRRLGD